MNPGQRSPSKSKAQSQNGSTCNISLLMPHICVLMALPPSASGAVYAALDVFCALPPPATEVQSPFPIQQLQSLHACHYKNLHGATADEGWQALTRTVWADCCSNLRLHHYAGRMQCKALAKTRACTAHCIFPAAPAKGCCSSQRWLTGESIDVMILT